MALLKIQISSFDGKEYYVKIDKLDSEVVPIEYVRVVLNFACRMLYTIPQSDLSQIGGIYLFLERIINTDLKPDEVNRLVEYKIKPKEGQGLGRKVSGTLYFKDVGTRNLITSIPSNPHENQYANSVIALIWNIVNKLDPFHLTVLKDSLQYIHIAAKQGRVDHSSIQRMATLPNEAFLNRHAMSTK